jgi:SET domain-containing protein
VWHNVCGGGSSIGDDRKTSLGHSGLGRVRHAAHHQEHANCYTRVIGDTIWIIAARNIRKGEELTYDYSTDGEGSIPCRCKPGCKVMI